MRRMLIAILLASISGTSFAQVNIRPRTNLSMYNACMNSAISNNDVQDNGRYIEYLCFGGVARRWWNSLDTDGQRDVKESNGEFISRYYGNSGYCAHQIADAAGNGADAYVCAIDAASPN
ncbi:hypothetical protein GGE67_004676 [Rhizobium leucaenae]|nr:hypothetical protein [Rhizobium leucaenae]